jgi:hypothetical protein
MKFTQIEQLASFVLIRDLQALVPQVTTKKSVRLIQQRMEQIRRERYVSRCRAELNRQSQSEWQTGLWWASQGKSSVDYSR